MKPGQHVILMGPQGAGKGTQAERLAPALGLAHLSTGAIFRSTIKSGTEVGEVLRGYLDRGELVPDGVTLDVVAAALAALDAGIAVGGPTGALFDGFPRTTAQAEGLETTMASLGHGIAAVVTIDVPRDVLIERLSGRLTCPVCGTIYHVAFRAPLIPGICDNEGATLEQRADDTPEAIGRRLDLYAEQTKPLERYYDERGLLRRVDGEATIDDVTRALVSAITAMAPSDGA